MTRYIAVVHHWFVSSNGFTIQEFSAADDDAAQQHADALAHRMDTTFSKTAVQLVKIGDAVMLSPRRLSWRERFTGRLMTPTPAKDNADG